MRILLLLLLLGGCVSSGGGNVEASSMATEVAISNQTKAIAEIEKVAKSLPINCKTGELELQITTLKNNMQVIEASHLATVEAAKCEVQAEKNVTKIAKEKASFWRMMSLWLSLAIVGLTYLMIKRR